MKPSDIYALIPLGLVAGLTAMGAPAVAVAGAGIAASYIYCEGYRGEATPPSWGKLLLVILAGVGSLVRLAL